MLFHYCKDVNLSMQFLKKEFSMFLLMFSKIKAVINAAKVLNSLLIKENEK